jgi:hypothetical protein
MDINITQLLLRKLLFDQAQSQELKAKLAMQWFEHDAQALIDKLSEEEKK